MKRIISLLAAVLLLAAILPASAFASTFVDAHGNTIELDDTLEAYTDFDLLGANDAARKGESNLGDLWTDALRWFAVSGRINEYFEEDDVAIGNTSIAVDADHIVAVWNGGNLRDDLPAGKFDAQALAKVLPYPNKVAVVYLTGEKLAEMLEASAYGQPYTEASAASCASLLQVSGLKYTVDTNKMFAKGEAYGKNWFKVASPSQVSVQEVNGKALDAAATYAVITSNAYFNGMDSAYVFKEAAAADNRCAITTAVVRDVIWMYIAEELGNHIEKYEKPEGRLTILAPAFADVEGGSYYAQPVAWAVEKGITGGTSADAFSPLASCTRAQAMTFLWVAAGKPEFEKEDIAFVDVPEGAYYEKAVRWAAAKGITSGTGEGKFSPDAKITRAQAIAFLYAAAGRPEVAGGEAFTDIPEGAYYKDAASWASAKGITGGVGEGLFGGDRLCTRAQIVTFLYNAYK